MTVQEYHALPHLSSSRIKLFSEDRWKFKKSFVDKIPVADKNTNSKTIGDLGDFYLLRDADRGTGTEHFDDVFTLYSGKLAGGQMGEVVEELYNITLDATENGEITKSFEQMLEEAYNAVAFDKENNHIKLKIYKTYAAFITAFEREGMAHYQFLRDHKDSKVVTMKQIESAEHAYTKATTHPFTRNIFLNKNMENLNQLPVIFNHLDVTCKILLDKVLIDHNRKIIGQFDLKITWGQETFYDNFTYLKYYIQAALYWVGMQKFRDENLPGYKLLPFEFTIIPTTFTQAPLRFNFQEEDLDKLLNKFTFRGREYKGINPLIESLKWNLETQNWSSSKEDHENKGVRKIQIL